MKELVKGVIPAMITIFKDNDSIDEQGTRDHVNFLIENGVHAISPEGSTGEMIALTLEERMKLIEIVIEEVRGRVPVYPGTMHYTTDITIRLSRFAESKGADGVLVIPPYYMNPPRHDVIDYYRAIRQEIKIPIILYNNIWFSGYEFDPWEVAELVDEGVLQGIKDAHGDPWKIHTLKHLCSDKFVVYYGHDINGLAALLVGADGWLTGGVNLTPGLFVDLYNTVCQGNIKEARNLWDIMVPLINFICVNKRNNYPHFVQIFKDGLNMMGRKAGLPRKPLTPLKAQERNKLHTLLSDLGLI